MSWITSRPGLHGELTMSNHVGTQFVAPQGFEQLEVGRTYFLLRSDVQRDRVVLLYFIQRPMVSSSKSKKPKRRTPLPMPVLIGLRRTRFEEGLTSGAIVRSDVQASLPPWLLALEGQDLIGFDLLGRTQGRSKAYKSHQDRIDQILQHIWLLVERFDEVLGAADPAKVINAHARACNPPQNESRVRLWFFTYLVFGRRRDALHYPIQQIGKWDRSTRSQKLGRPSLARGAQCGFTSCDLEMIAKIVRGFRRFAGLGGRMSQIYRKTMLKEFGCVPVKGEDGYSYFIHPDGRPFPTNKQFSYRVIQHFSIREVQRLLFGSERVRNELAPSLGRFTEAVGNLMERIEADGYWVEEIAKGYIDGEHLPPLVTVRLRCTTSGMIVGIGFSVGGEKGEAYRMALFCAAIGKVRFFELFGMTIEEWEWPSIGLPPHYVIDRGPGSTRKGQARNQVHRPSNVEMAPSWSGQSKAIVESSHPRSLNLPGQPTFRPTSMSLTELALREAMRVIADNDACDVGPRLNHKAIAAGVTSTPIGLWNYLDGLCRNDAVFIPFETAVREFLPTIELDLRADGVYLEEQRYDGDSLRASGLLERVATTQSTKVHGYMFPLAVRQVFVETSKGLVTVPAMLNLRDDKRQLYVSVAELSQIAHLRKMEQSKARVHRVAARARIERRFEEQTGHAFDSRARQTGRPKRGTAAAKQEAAEAKRYVAGKRGRS